jgi:hypothetical protein
MLGNILKKAIQRLIVVATLIKLINKTRKTLTISNNLVIVLIIKKVKFKVLKFYSSNFIAHFICNNSCASCCNPNQGLISSTFHLQLLCTQIPKVQERLTARLYFFALLGSSHVKASSKMLVKSTTDNLSTL